MADRAALETELLLDSGFFHTLEQRLPRLGLVSIQLKQGQHANEMRDFRSDVILQAGVRCPPLAYDRTATVESPGTLAPIREALAARPPMLRVVAIRNARLDRIDQVARKAHTGLESGNVDALRQALDAPAHGIEPGALWGLDADYAVEVRFGRQAGTCDALFRHRQLAPPGVWSAPPIETGRDVANMPRRRLEADGLPGKLRDHLKQFLPEYMLPQAFVILDAFPLTPNGKIDRKALPQPTHSPASASSEYLIPSNELELTIAGIWREMLGIERVGRKDNIFDLGASSLLTVEANNRLQNALGRKIPLVSMFRYPTIEALACHLANSIAAGDPARAAAPVPPPAEQERTNRLAAAAERRRAARAQSA